MQYHKKTHGAQHNKICNTAYQQLIQDQTIEDPDTATTTRLQVTDENAKVEAETLLT
jgi:hypothetical protein